MRPCAYEACNTAPPTTLGRRHWGLCFPHFQRALELAEARVLSGLIFQGLGSDSTHLTEARGLEPLEGGSPFDLWAVARGSLPSRACAYPVCRRPFLVLGRQIFCEPHWTRYLDLVRRGVVSAPLVRVSVGVLRLSDAMILRIKRRLLRRQRGFEPEEAFGLWLLDLCDNRRLHRDLYRLGRFEPKSLPTGVVLLGLLR